MSQLSTPSPKHSVKKGSKLFNNKKLLFSLFTIFTILVSLILLVWFILHPSRPEFSLEEVGIYQLKLNSGTDHFLNSSIQLTLHSKNPNQKVGIYYDDLQLYATYKGQRISEYTYIPPFYQVQEDNNMLTATLVGTGLLPFDYLVGRDETLILNLKAVGQLRWKVGSWVSGRYRLNIDCVVIFPLGSSLPTTGPLTSKQGAICCTSV